MLACFGAYTICYIGAKCFSWIFHFRGKWKSVRFKPLFHRLEKHFKWNFIYTLIDSLWHKIKLGSTHLQGKMPFTDVQSTRNRLSKQATNELSHRLSKPKSTHFDALSLTFAACSWKLYSINILNKSPKKYGLIRYVLLGIKWIGKVCLFLMWEKLSNHFFFFNFKSFLFTQIIYHFCLKKNQILIRSHIHPSIYLLNKHSFDIIVILCIDLLWCCHVTWISIYSLRSIHFMSVTLWYFCCPQKGIWRGIFWFSYKMRSHNFLT